MTNQTKVATKVGHLLEGISPKQIKKDIKSLLIEINDQADSEWDIDSLSANQMVSLAASLKNQLSAIGDNIFVAACCHPEFTPTQRLDKEGLAAVLKQALSIPLDENFQTNATARDLIEAYGLLSGVTEEEMPNYIKKSMEAYSANAWDYALSRVSSHPSILMMEETGHNTTSDNYKKRTYNNGINHAMAERSKSASIMNRIESLEARVAELECRQEVTEERVTEVEKETKQIKKRLPKAERNRQIKQLAEAQLKVKGKINIKAISEKVGSKRDTVSSVLKDMGFK